MLYNYIPRVFHLGPISIRFYGISIALGILIAMLVGARNARRQGMPGELVYDFGLYAITMGLVLARLVYVLFDLDYYMQNPIRILAIYQGGLSFHGGVLGGILAAVWFVRKHKLSFWAWADTLAPAIVLGEAIGRIGCDVYGRQTEGGFFSLVINGTSYHNVPLYTAVTSLLVFAVLWSFKGKLARGNSFWLFVALYSLVRFFLEFYRNSVMVGTLSATQWASTLLFALAFVLLARNLKRS